MLSLTGHSGIKWGRFRLGGIAELHASNGKEAKNDGDSEDNMSRYYWGESQHVDAFRLLVVGPELGYATGRFQIKVHRTWVINNSPATLDDLGDVMDRGSGLGGFGTSAAMEF